MLGNIPLKLNSMLENGETCFGQQEKVGSKRPKEFRKLLKQQKRDCSVKSSI